MAQDADTYHNLLFNPQSSAFPSREQKSISPSSHTHSLHQSPLACCASATYLNMSASKFISCVFLFAATLLASFGSPAPKLDHNLARAPSHFAPSLTKKVVSRFNCGSACDSDFDCFFTGGSCNKCRGGVCL